MGYMFKAKFTIRRLCRLFLRMQRYTNAYWLVNSTTSEDGVYFFFIFVWKKEKNIFCSIVCSFTDYFKVLLDSTFIVAMRNHFKVMCPQVYWSQKKRLVKMNFATSSTWNISSITPPRRSKKKRIMNNNCVCKNWLHPALNFQVLLHDALDTCLWYKKNLLCSMYRFFLLEYITASYTKQCLYFGGLWKLVLWVVYF